MQADDLKRIRKELALTQAELGAALDLTDRAVRLMERGTQPIDRRTALAIRYLIEHPECLGRISQ